MFAVIQYAAMCISTYGSIKTCHLSAAYCSLSGSFHNVYTVHHLYNFIMVNYYVLYVLYARLDLLQ